jgi:hypothetical protein
MRALNVFCLWIKGSDPFTDVFLRGITADNQAISALNSYIKEKTIEGKATAFEYLTAAMG